MQNLTLEFIIKKSDFLTQKLLKKVTETGIILKFKCKKKSETLLKIHFFHKKTLKNSFLMTYDPFFF